MYCDILVRSHDNIIKGSHNTMTHNTIFDKSKTLSEKTVKKHLDKKIADKYCFLLLDTVDSTNTLAKKLAGEGVKKPLVIISDHQSAGRGRLGRSFYSPMSDGLYMSVLIDPEKEKIEIPTITHFVATAVADAIEELCDGVKVGIKWVNDLLIDGKKICGILCESGRSGDGVDFTVIGIGVNLSERDFPDDIRNIAGSVYSCTGQMIDRARLAANIIKNLDKYAKGFMDRYRQRSVVIGKRVKVISYDDTYFAKAISISDDGSLNVEDENGQIQKLCFGEISLRLDKEDSV